MKNMLLESISKMQLKAWICIDSPDGEKVSDETCAKICDMWINNPRPNISKDYEGTIHENCYFLYDTKNRVLAVIHSRLKKDTPCLSATFRRDVPESVVKSEDALLSYIEYSYKEGYENLWYHIIKSGVVVNIPESAILDKYDLSGIFDYDIQILKLAKKTKVNVRYSLEYVEPKIERFITKCFRVYLNTVETTEFDDIFLEKAQFYNIPLPDEIRIITNGSYDIRIEYYYDQTCYLIMVVETCAGDTIRENLIYFYKHVVPNRSFFTVSDKVYQEIIPYLSRFGYRETQVRIDGKEDVIFNNDDFTQKESSGDLFSCSIPIYSYVIKMNQEVTLE